MNIGIVIFSHTGNTESVAQRLKEKVEGAGHSATIEKIIPADDTPTDVKQIQLRTKPDVSSYDGLIFGAPVRGFAVSAVMAAYLMQLSSLKGKKIACFVTEAFPFPWMGGNRAIDQMKKAVETKDAKVWDTGVVNWMNKRREEMIADLVERFSELY